MSTKRKFRVMDTVTIDRVFYVYAKDEESAIEKVSDNPAKYFDSEDQVDSTPWTADEVDDDPVTKAKTTTIQIDGVCYRILPDGAVTAPPDPTSAMPGERQRWWASHPFAQFIRKRKEQRAHDRLMARMCEQFAGGVR